MGQDKIYTDIVYVLGSESQWNDGELRYSLRSVEKFLIDYGNIYVVGKKPAWLAGVIHLPYPDKYVCREANMMEKMAYACGHPDLSKIFLLIHDDHFCLDYQRADSIPNWCGGSLESVAKTVNFRNHWRNAVLNTHKALSERGLTTHNFDIHFPMLFDKELFPKIMDEYDWKGTERGFVVKSLYANTLKVQPTFTTDLLINYRYDFSSLVGRLKGRPWLSVNNYGLNNNFKGLMEKVYPNKSIFELQ